MCNNTRINEITGLHTKAGSINLIFRYSAYYVIGSQREYFVRCRSTI